jgi:hypothetical protein
LRRPRQQRDFAVEIPDSLQQAPARGGRELGEAEGEFLSFLLASFSGARCRHGENEKEKRERERRKRKKK